MNKYGAKKTVVDGITFDSKREAERWLELKLLLRAGEISNLERQKKFVLIPAFTKEILYPISKIKKFRECSYIADFVYVDNQTGQTVVEDAKGYKTEIYKLKKKWFEYLYEDLTIIET